LLHCALLIRQSGAVSKAFGCGYLVLKDMGVSDHRLLLVRGSRTPKRFDCRGGLPLLEHVDTAAVECVCAQVEVDTARSRTSETNGFGTSGQVRLTLLGLDEEGTGNDDHRSILPEMLAAQNCRSVRGVTVARRRYRPIMDVIAEARERGFVLEERVLGDAWVQTVRLPCQPSSAKIMTSLTESGLA